MNWRLFLWVFAVVTGAFAAIILVPEPYTLPAAFSIFGAFMVVEAVRTLRAVRDELAKAGDTPPASSLPSRRVELLGLALAAVWLVPVLAALVTMNLILLGFDHTSPRFWIAVGAVVAAFEVLVWGFAVRGFLRARRAG